MPLNKSAKQREGPFSGIPSLHRHFGFEITFSPGTLVADGSQVGDPVPYQSGSCRQEQHLLERRLNHSGSGRDGAQKPALTKAKGCAEIRRGIFPKANQGEASVVVLCGHLYHRGVCVLLVVCVCIVSLVTC